LKSFESGAEMECFSYLQISFGKILAKLIICFFCLSLGGCVFVKPVEDDNGLGIMESRLEPGTFEVSTTCSRMDRAFDENKQKALIYCKKIDKNLFLKSQVAVSQGILPRLCTTQFTCVNKNIDPK
jgi:hypothetical protein